MTEQTFSRDYLRGLADERKKQLSDQVINGFIKDLQNSAAAGETSYLFNIAEFEEKQALRIQKQVEINRLSEQLGSHKFRMPPPIQLTREDLIAAFQKKFPDCCVGYTTYWIDAVTNPDLKYSVGIMIDWS